MSGRGRVEGKVALITGGASGLGRASAVLLAAEGARVMVSDMDEAGGNETVAEVCQQSGSQPGEIVSFRRQDVTEEQGWKDTVAATTAAYGGLDILVNSAGVGIMKDVEATTLEEWRWVHAVNTDGVFLGCKYGIGAMKEGDGGGSIVNLSSVSGLIGGHNMAAYNSSKAGVRLLSKSVALHCARQGYGIRCNSVHPTFIETPMVKAMFENAPEPDKVRQKLERQVPVGRFGQPEEVADMILYLSSDESRFVTGAEFVIDGGLTAM